MSAAAGTTQAEWSFASEWGATGFVTDLDGPVHWVRWDGPSTGGGEPMVLVHGLGGSHLNWVGVGAAWAQERTVYAVDLPGFGLSPGHPRDTAVAANAATLARFVEEVVGGPAVVVGNSMGAMVSALTASARPDLVTRLVLIDPALPLVRLHRDRTVAGRFALFALPYVGEAAMRHSRRTMAPEALAAQLLDLCFADRSRVDPQMVAKSAALARARAGQSGIDESFLRAARSLLRRLTVRGSYWGMLGRLSQPVLLVHGEADRLVDVASAREAGRRFPRWEVHVLPGVGHTPQLETPQEVAGLVTRWLTDHAGADHG